MRGIAPMAVGLTLAAASAAAQGTPTATANDVKAAYLLNFTRYVEWPPDAFAARESPIVICVVGKDPFGRALDEIVRDRRVNGRRIEVRRLVTPVARDACHVAFLAAGEAALAHAREAWPSQPVLLVGDDPGFAADGGTIGFVPAEETIRFEINADAARRTGLRISSRVMTLATHIYGTGEGP
jgi:hypothetical protein